MTLDKALAKLKPEEVATITSDYKNFLQHNFVYYDSKIRAVAEAHAVALGEKPDTFRKHLHPIGQGAMFIHLRNLERRIKALEGTDAERKD